MGWIVRATSDLRCDVHRNSMVWVSSTCTDELSSTNLGAPPAVESRRDGRLEVRDSAAATGDWNSFQSRMNTGEHGLAIAKLHLSRKTHSDCHGRAPTPLRHRRGLQKSPHARNYSAPTVVKPDFEDTYGITQWMDGTELGCGSSFRGRKYRGRRVIAPSFRGSRVPH